MAKHCNNEVAVVGVVYPGIEDYLEDYFCSLEKQTLKHFDLIIANDGLKKDIASLPGRGINSYIINVDGTVSSNRRTLINEVIERGYQKIIFTDCDDVFKENRFEVACDLLDIFSIVTNELDLIDPDGEENQTDFFSTRFGKSRTITVNDLISGNMMGLSNTALKIEVLQDCPALISGESIAFDWYLWSSILLKGYKAMFTAETSTKYRIHDQNIAGLPQPLTEKSVAKGVEVKLQHYGLMSKYDDMYSELAIEFQRVSEQLEDKIWQKEYLAALQECAIDQHMWWENIRIPLDVGL